MYPNPRRSIGSGTAGCVLILEVLRGCDYACLTAEEPQHVA